MVSEKEFHLSTFKGPWSSQLEVDSAGLSDESIIAFMNGVFNYLFIDD